MMDTAVFAGLALIAVALFMGLFEVARSIRSREVTLRFDKPININHRGGDGSPT